MGFPVSFEGRVFEPAKNRGWTTTKVGIGRLARAGRLGISGSTLRYKRFFVDFLALPITDFWDDTQSGSAMDKVYVVQTSERIVERCILMASDAGDLVLDPTCGSGTTAYVAEQWGRRWITIDTSRVALALARARIMGARYPYYLLADSREGQVKEAELNGGVPSERAVYQSVRHGFVCERIPHVTLRAIANNAQIDVIWEEWQARLAVLRSKLNAVLAEEWEEWQMPRDAACDWPDAASMLHAEWWKARLARQKEIDASIAANAECEYLCDRPYEDKKKVRVAGPFTVESLSPHRVLRVDENDELVDQMSEEADGGYKARQTFP
jgi:adenine-specific DNA-methyltransferase